MAHELNFEDGQASMMYVDEVPWYGLGTHLETPPTSAEEAIKAAHLDHHSNLETPWQRMNSICFGESERLKHRALDQAVALVSLN